MDRAELQIEFESNVSNYKNTLDHVLNVIQDQLKGTEIDISAVQSRIKTFESFYEKIGRKKYEDPFLRIEDIAGIRIICYYPSDVETIEQIIKNSFEIQSSVDKSSLLDVDKFGYRSSHFVVKPKSNSTEQDLDYKVEVQVRTLLMHAWASIQGKLEYKKEEHSPKQFRRKLMQLSALLELADQQFQDLKKEKEHFRTTLENNINRFDDGVDMSIDSFFAFIDVYFPHRKLDYRYTKTLFIELKKLNIGFQDIIEGIEQTKSMLEKMEKELEGQNNSWSKDVALKTLLELSNQAYWHSRPRDYLQSSRGRSIQKWRKLLKD